MEIEDKEVRLDIAGEVLRMRYSLENPQDLHKKWVKRIRRKFKVKTDVDTIAKYADRYNSHYDSGKENLKECLRPPTGGYASADNVDDSKFMRLLKEEYPEEDEEILEIVKFYVVYYEYLR